MKKIKEIYYTLPWGNDGRGTRVYLWPFLWVIGILFAAWIIDNWIIV
jgi:hypothetical protein